MSRKVYLKFRLEVLSGARLLFQDLIVDPRFDDSAIHLYDNEDCSVPREYLKRIYNGDNGKDCLHIGKNNPILINSKNAHSEKEYLLRQLSSFYKWGGFEDDFKELEIYTKITPIFPNGNTYYFGTNLKPLLNYEIWQRDEFTFLKVNYADDCFTHMSFFNKEFKLDPRYLSVPFLYYHYVHFKGDIPELQNNIDKVHTKNITFDINKINNQVLKFLNEKFQLKQPELVDLGNNVYEVRS